MNVTDSYQNVWFSPYQLIPRSSLGPRSEKRARRGVLCRFEFAGLTQSGFADLHSWPELGDLPLDEQVRSLLSGEGTDLTRQTLKFARLDAEARSENKSLWEGLKIPLNHALITNLNELSPEYLEKLFLQGFRTLKLKVGGQLEQEVAQLKHLEQYFEKFSFLLRLDFNSVLNRTQLGDFLGALGEVRDRLDFIEDPIPYNAHEWTDVQDCWGIRLALDRLPKSTPQVGSFAVLVHKPALQKISAALNLATRADSLLVITSYLDHPLGQLTAAWTAGVIQAQEPSRVEPCGLLSQKVYEPNCFSEMLDIQNNRLNPPSGAGFGWQKELDNLDWMTSEKLFLTR